MDKIPIHELSDRWILPCGPNCDIVISSRCRLARNLTGHPFTRSATPEQRSEIASLVAKAIVREPLFEDYTHFELSEIPGADRTVLRESHLISPELERHSREGAVFLSSRANVSIMVNEEDHLRMQAILPGYQVLEAHRIIDAVDDALSLHLPFAFNSQLGYLTACPTNTGTGLRASVMMHLPGLVLSEQIEKIIKDIANHGFAVRGIYGEGTHCAGDLYQISNEVTLGKSELEIIESLLGVIDQLVEREREARSDLFRNRQTFVEDSIWRSFATLTQARMMNSSEATQLLSRLRLGIDHGHFGDQLPHHELNRLIIAIQPAHLISAGQSGSDTDARDVARADYLRGRLKQLEN